MRDLAAQERACTSRPNSAYKNEKVIEYARNIIVVSKDITHLLITSFPNQMGQRKFHDVAKKLDL